MKSIDAVGGSLSKFDWKLGGIKPVKCPTFAFKDSTEGSHLTDKLLLGEVRCNDWRQPNIGQLLQLKTLQQNWTRMNFSLMSNCNIIPK